MDDANRAWVALTFTPEDGDTSWRVRSAQLDEGLNELYSLRIELVSDSADAEPVQMLGTSVELAMARGTLQRKITGIVAMVEEGDRAENEAWVQATLEVRPALEALRHRRDTRIFQDKTVPQILSEVLEAGLSGYKRSVDDRTTRAYPTCEYRVQYDETDLDFCQRLMEEEGIVYFFEFEGDQETLVLTDDGKSYGTIESAQGATLERGRNAPGAECVDAFARRHRITPTKLATRHFDWTKPTAPIEGASSNTAPDDDPHGSFLEPEREIYEHDRAPLTFSQFDGNAYGTSDVSDQGSIRGHTISWSARVFEGRSTVTALRSGATFDTSGHEELGLDGSYVVIKSRHEFYGDELDMLADGVRADRYQNTFECIPKTVAFRPERRTPRPAVASTVTARVVGPAGEEIHTDVHGRIRVQFHWDRLGAMDEHSSCWMRVMQPWAGAGWGFTFIPRIGMEVLVEFVEGDLDRPMVVGAAYDGERRPPYALPGEKTKSTIKTESSIGGGGNNELRFEDLAGSEEIYIHGQKDFNEVVENDHSTLVHNDQKIRVDVDQKQEIGANQTEHVFANQDLTVDANRTQSVHGSATETIDGSETRTVSSGVTETISAGETRTVSGGMTETISGGRTQTISGGSTETISGSLTQTVTGGINITTPSTYTIKAAGGLSLTTPAATTFIALGGYKNLCPGGQTCIDESWASMGNTKEESYLMKASAVVVRVGIVLGPSVALYAVHFDMGGAKVAMGGSLDEIKGMMLGATIAHLKSGNIFLRSTVVENRY